MEAEKKCEKCGADMPEGVTTCTACGHTAGEEVVHDAPAEEAAM